MTKPEGQLACKIIDGRIHAARRLMHPDTPGLTGDTKWVDLTPFAGTPIWLARHVVETILDEWHFWTAKMISCGQFELKSDQHRKDWIRFDPASTFETLKTAFLGQTAAPSSYKEFDDYVEARGCYRVDSTEPYPDHVLDAAIQFLMDIGPTSLIEVRGVLSVPKPEGRFMKMLDARKPGFWRSLVRYRDEIDIEEFAEYLPGAVRRAPGTCFDPADGGDRPAPTAQILARLAKLVHLRDIASLHVLRSAGRGSLVGYLSTLMNDLEFLESLIDANDIDIRDEGQVTWFLDGLAVRDTLAPSVSDNRRHVLVSTWLGMVRQAELLASLTPVGGDRDLRSVVPAGHRDGSRFSKGVRKRFGSIIEYSEARKERANDLSDRFDFVIAAARRRCDQLADFTDDAVNAKAELLRAGHERVKIETVSHILNHDGSYGAGQQIIHGWAWDGEALWRRIHAEGILKGDDLKPWRDAIKRGKPLGRGRVYYQYERSEGIDGAVPVEPWFATVFKAAVTMSPAKHSVETRERRAALMRAWKLPSPDGLFGRLLSYDLAGSFTHRFAEKIGVSLMALEEFDHAMRMAHLAFRAGTIVGCRANETIQMAYHAKGWPVLQTGPAKGYTGWLAVPGKPRDVVAIGSKDFAKRLYLVDSITYIYFNDLAQVAIRRSDGSFGNQIPLMEPVDGLKWKCGEAPYVFSLDGRAITPGALNRYLRYLLGGIQLCTLHDARHSSANRGWVEGESISDTMLRLGHAVERHSRYYRARGTDALSAASVGALDRRTSRHDLRYWEKIVATA